MAGRPSINKSDKELKIAGAAWWEVEGRQLPESGGCIPASA